MPNWTGNWKSMRNDWKIQFVTSGKGCKRVFVFFFFLANKPEILGVLWCRGSWIWTGLGSIPVSSGYFLGGSCTLGREKIESIDPGRIRRGRENGAPVTHYVKMQSSKLIYDAEWFPYPQQRSVVFLFWHRNRNRSLLKKSPCPEV